MDLARLRNFGIVAHIDAGKTTVSERILFYTGVEHRMGEVHDGTATMDWMEQERERGITITAAVTACDWREHRLQLIDTPGHVDFTVEVERSLRVLDGAIVVLDAVAGVQPQTETVLRQARRHRVPLVYLVNKMDRLGADFDRAVASIAALGDVPPIPVQLPLGAGAEFDGVIDLIGEELLVWTDDLGRECRREPIPETLRPAAEEARDRLCGAVAEVVESWTDPYLEQGRLSAEQLHAGLREAVRGRQLAPVLAGAALRNRGIQPVLDAVVDWLPSPLERAVVRGEAPDGTLAERRPSRQEPTTALVFKMLHDSYGDLHFARVFAGVLRAGDKLVVARTGQAERIGRLLRLHAEERTPVDEAGPGELVAIAGLKHAATGDTLCPAGSELALEGMEFPEPVLRVTVEPKEPGQAQALLDALACLDREDPTLQASVDPDTGQHLLGGMGELHLEIVQHRLVREFGLDVRTGAPQVAYREALRDSGQARASLELPGAETPLHLEAELRVRPQPEASGPVLRVDPSWLRRLPDRAKELAPEAFAGESGPWGLPLSGLEVELVALNWSPEAASLPAGAVQGVLTRALRAALAGKTEVREPWMELVVRAPEEAISGVLADLNSRSAEIEQVDPGRGEIRARVPLAEMFAYSTQLRSQTQGKGEFSMRLADYAAPTGSRWTELAGRLGISEQE